MSYGIETRTKATTIMGVIACRSREASLIPNDIRINATTECYWSNFRSKKRGRSKCVPGCGKKSPDCTERAR